MLYLAAGTPQYIYQGIQKYFVIGLMKLYWSKPSENISLGIICIIL